MSFYQMAIIDTLFREASRMNSNAVVETARGNAAEASLIFRHALEYLSHINGTLRGQNHTPPSPRNVSSSPLEFSSDDSGFCVYNKLLTFEQTGRPPNNVDLPFYSAAIMFNLGLIYHQHGTAIGSTKFYQAADHMYEKCLNILQSFPTFCDAEMDALQLAALNNRTHIAFKRGTYDSDDQSLAKIRELSCMLLFSNETTMPLHWEESMINEILINSMVSGPGGAASA